MAEPPNPFLLDADALTGETQAVRHAVLAIGSNLGERLTALQGAVNSLGDTPGVWVTAVSPVYETEPVDCPPDADTFLNAVVAVDTTLAPELLLERALAIEDAFNRERTGVRNAPRTLDVDVIVVGDARLDEPRLQLPHPRAAERAFVLRPWLDLDPDAEVPGAGPVADLLAAADQSGVARRDDLVLEVQ